MWEDVEEQVYAITDKNVEWPPFVKAEDILLGTRWEWEHNDASNIIAQDIRETH